MPSSLQARMIRRAISPRLAIRIFLNIARRSTSSPTEDPALAALYLFDTKKCLAELHRLSILRQDLGNDARALGLDLVHHLHGLDDADHGVRSDLLACADVGRSIRRRRRVERAHHRRLYFLM